jgi:hypothetical protein
MGLFEGIKWYFNYKYLQRLNFCKTGMFLEENFGENLTKPFEYNIAASQGLVFE